MGYTLPTTEQNAPPAVDDWLERMSAFAAGLRYEDLPPAVVRAARERLIDALACSLGSLALPEGCPPADAGWQAATSPIRPERAGMVVGTSDVLSAESATFVNGCLVRYLDFSDTYPGHHPSDALAALFAVAPVAGVRGGDLIAALVVSYELSIRLTRSGRFNRRGWDNGYATGIGTAAAVARLMGLGRESLHNAVAIIATANMPMRATRSGQLSMWKGAATAYSVRDAVFAAQLAAAGMTGPEAPFTGRHGVIDLITGPMTLEALPNEGGDYLVPKVKLKYWPIVHNMQPLVWAGIELRQRLAGAQPEHIELATCFNAWRESGSEPEKWDPRTRETADHSAPYILAYVLRHGSIDDRAFQSAAYLDQSYRPDMGRISVRVDDEIEAAYPDTVRMRVVATDSAGKRHEIDIENPLGHERNPMTRADIDAKFNRLAGRLISASRLDAALEAWWTIDDRDVSTALLMLVADDPERLASERRLRHLAR